MSDPDEDSDDEKGLLGKDDSVDPPKVQERIGYRNPPRKHAFPKGRSGNPGGRPKGSRNKIRDSTVSAKIMKIMNRSVPLKGSEAGSITLLQANVQTLAVQGAQGGVVAARSTAWLAMAAEEYQTRQRQNELNQIARYLSALRPALDKFQALSRTSAVDAMFSLTSLIETLNPNTTALPDAPVLLESVPFMLAETRALLRKCRKVISEEREFYDSLFFVAADEEDESATEEGGVESEREEDGSSEPEGGEEELPDGETDDFVGSDEVIPDANSEKKSASLKRLDMLKRTMVNLRAIELNLKRKLDEQ